MKILFVAAGNNPKFEIPPLIAAQGDSLRKAGINIDYFLLIGKGINGYISNIFKLRKYVKNNSVDIIHAHYSFAGVVASLANTRKPIVVSLLGSDVNGSGLIKKIILRNIPFISWDELIVKSAEMNSKIKRANSHVIPNGVDLNLFRPMGSTLCKNKLNWDISKRHILFAANPERPEKNFTLTEQAIDLINNDNVELHYFDNVEHKKIATWLNAADVVLLSSLWEGSPNVIKEAMACNRPIVATNVGDIEWLFGSEPGHFIADFTPRDFAEKIKLALAFADNQIRSNGRKRIIQLGLDSETVAKIIIGIYKTV